MAGDHSTIRRGESAPALAWYRTAADQGHIDALFALGVAYASGLGVQQDYVEAHKWRNLAASRVVGDTEKQYEAVRDQTAKILAPAQLAEAQQRAADWVIYSSGLGVRQVFSLAVASTREEANRGDALAQMDLGIMYATGDGVLHDHGEAHK